MLRAATFFAFLLLLACTKANDANMVSVGGAGSIQNNPDVQMVKEHVRIVLDNEEMHVKVTFWFKNFGPDQMVTMAFPDETSSNHQHIAQQNFQHAIKDFKSWVDSQPVKVSLQRLNPDEEFWIKNVWTKRVAFKRNQSRRVDVEYKATHGFAGSGWAIDRYVLRTGASWRGNIATCRIDVDWSKATRFSAPALHFDQKLKSTWSRPAPRKATITLKNIEPDFDLDLTMIQGFWNFVMNGQPMPQNIGLPHNDDLDALKGKPEDIQILIAKIPRFFSNGSTGSDRKWNTPEASAFGKSLEFADRRTVKTGKGKILKLRRPVEGPSPDESDEGYVYLKDLIEALGGTYAYDAILEQVNLTLPRK